MTTATTDASVRITVEGARQAAADLGAVDAAFRRVGEAAESIGRTRLNEIFGRAGISVSGATAEVDRLVARLEAVARQRAFRQLREEAGLSRAETARLQAGMGDLSGALGNLARGAGLAAAALAAGLGAAVKACLEAQMALERLRVSYTSVFGEGAAQQLDTIYEQTQRVGLKFSETAEAAKTFFASGVETELAPELNKIFTSVSNAGAALQLTGDEVQRVFLAMGQMISKGKVQAEELRGQLGEALPGAFQMAAKAMGMTTGELDKFMADGKLTAEELLPKLAAALQEMYGKAAENAADTLSGSLNRMSTEWERFKAGLLESGPAVFAINVVTTTLKTISDRRESEKAREEAWTSLRSRGVKPEGVRSEAQYDPAGNRIDPVTYGNQYSKAQIDAEVERLAIVKQGEAFAAQDRTQREKAAEKVIVEARQALNDSLKGTAADKIAKAREGKKEALEAIQAAIGQMRLDGTDAAVIAAWEKDYADAARAWDEKIAQAGKSGQKAASGAAAAQRDYAAAVAESEAEIQRLQQRLQLDPGDEAALARAKAEAEYEKAVRAATAAIDKQVASGKISPAQGQKLKALKTESLELEKQLALREADAQAQQKAIQQAEGQLAFYRELGDLSGDYSASVELQNRLIEEQARKYRDVLDIPPALVDEWERLQKLQASVDPFDGAYRGLQKYAAEYGNQAKQWESLTYSFASGFTDATRSMFDEFLDTGRVSLDSFGALFRQLLKDLAWQALAQPIMLSVVQGAAGAFGSLAPAGAAAGSAGVSGGAGGLGGLATGALQQAGQGWITNGLSGAINSAAAWAAPSLFAPTAAQGSVNAGLNAALQGSSGAYTGYTAGVQPTMTATGAFGAPALGAGIGSLASPFVNKALGIQNNAGSSIGATVGGLGATAVLGTLAAANIWNPGGWIMGGLAALSAIAGGAFGGLFGGKKKKQPQLWAGFDLDLANGTTGAWADPNRGLSNETADQYEASLESVAQSVITMSGNVRSALGEVNGALADAYQAALVEGGSFKKRVMWEGEYITEGNTKRFLEELMEGGMGLIVGALSRMDVTPLTLAADGAVADTAAEMKTAIANAVNFLAIGESFEDEKFKEQFYSGIGNRILDALNAMDTSGLKLNIDKTSVAGWQTAAAALEAWDSVNAAINEIIEPTSALQTQMAAANQQFDGWLAQLRQLGWQEEAIAEVEAKRARYLQQYSDAMTKATTQELHLRKISLQYGAKSDMYGMESLYIQQQQELEQLAQKFGKESQIYKDAVEIQQAELARQRVEQLEAELEAALQAEQRLAQEEAQAALSAAQASLAAAEAAKAATEQRISELERELEAARQAIIDAQKAVVDAQQQKVDALQAEFDAAVKAQEAKISALQQELTEALRARRDAVQEQLSEADRLRTTFARLTDSMRDTRRDLWSSDAANPLGTSFAESRAAFESAVSKALSGDEDAFSSLPALADQLLERGRGSLATQDDYTELFFSVDQKLKAAQDYAAKQADAQRAEVDALTAQLEALNEQLGLGKKTHREIQDIQRDLEREQKLLQDVIGAEEETHRNLGVIRDELLREQDILEEQIAKLEALTRVEEETHRALEDIEADLAEQRAILARQTEAAERQNALTERLQAAMTAGTEATSSVGRTSAQILAELQRVRNVLASEKADVGKVTPTVPEQVRPSTGSGSGSSSSGSGSSSGSSGSTYSGAVTRVPGVTRRIPDYYTTAAGKGVHGSRFASELYLKSAIAMSMSDMTEIRPPSGYTNWGQSGAVDASLKEAGLTLAQWYARYGKARGFASGGATPAHEAFVVGEYGPEIIASPRQWRVISHPQSMALAAAAQRTDAANAAPQCSPDRWRVWTSSEMRGDGRTGAPAAIPSAPNGREASDAHTATRSDRNADALRDQLRLIATFARRMSDALERLDRLGIRQRREGVQVA